MQLGNSTSPGPYHHISMPIEEAVSRELASAQMSTTTFTTGGHHGHRGKKSFRGGIQYKFAVFPGNYPQYIRDALSEREGRNVIWIELEPNLESINICDFVWKPFNYQKNVRNC